MCKESQLSAKDVTLNKRLCCVCACMHECGTRQENGKNKIRSILGG